MAGLIPSACLFALGNAPLGWSALDLAERNNAKGFSQMEMGADPNGGRKSDCGILIARIGIPFAEAQ